MKRVFSFICKKLYSKISPSPLNNSHILELLVSYTADMNFSFFVSHDVLMFFPITLQYVMQPKSLRFGSIAVVGLVRPVLFPFPF
jgi:hypothetical protein